MVTISHIVKKYVSDKPFLQEALGNKIINYANLADQLHPFIEQELNKKVKFSAIMMALRRYSDEITFKTSKSFNFSGEIVMKTNMCDITVIKSSRFLNMLNSIFNLVNFERGDVLNVILGNNEASIIINEKYSDKLTKFLKGEKIVNKEKNLVSLTLSFTADDFVHSPGVIFTVIRKLAWENINIYEVISTMTELTFILNKKDSINAYNILYELVNKLNKR